jgi:hypothetical protein
MATDRVAGSFRDPSGALFRHEGRVYRCVSRGYAREYDHLRDSGFFDEATAAGELIAHEEVDPSTLGMAESCHRVLLPEQLPFVSYPYEWCFSQLKDASAYNVQFLNGRPVFIDTLSFEPYPEGSPWVAYQQFCKHFLAPLALMAHGHIELRRLLRVNIDGIPLDVTSALLPFRTRLRPALLIHIHLHARSLGTHADKPENADKAVARGMSKTGLLGLVDSLEGAVKKLEWTPKGTEWGDYYAATNYSDAAMEFKRDVVAGFVERCSPSSVWDLGANVGYFSRVASNAKIQTVAADIDPAAVEKNYRALRESGETHLLPLLLDLTNPSPGLGWDFEERMSLRDRGPVDLAMALALVHHLAISNNVPLERIAEFFAGLAANLIIEFVPKSDSQVERLFATREDIFPAYTREGFEAAFEQFFELVERTDVRDSDRALYLYERRSRS